MVTRASQSSADTRNAKNNETTRASTVETGTKTETGTGTNDGDLPVKEDVRDHKDNGKEDRDASAAEILLSLSEAGPGDLEDVVIEVYNPRGKTKSLNLRLSAAARIRLASHISKRAKRDHAKAANEVQQFDRPSKYIAIDRDEACQACRDGGWACSIDRDSPNGRARTTNRIVGVRCAMCTSSVCTWPDNRQALSPGSKQALLDKWNASQEENMRKRKIWFETGDDTPAPSLFRSPLIPPISSDLPHSESKDRLHATASSGLDAKENQKDENESVGINNAGHSSLGGEDLDGGGGSDREGGLEEEEALVADGDIGAGGDSDEEEEDGDGDQPDNLGEGDEDGHRDLRPGESFDCQPVDTPASTRKRKPSPSPPDLSIENTSPSTPFPTIDTYSLSEAGKLDIKLGLAFLDTHRTTTLPTAKRLKSASDPVSAQPTKLSLISEYSSDRLEHEPDLPHYYVGPSPHIHDTGEHRTLHAYLACPSLPRGSSSYLHPSVARRFPLLTRVIEMKESLISQLSNLVTRSREEFIDTDTKGRKRISLPPYIYLSENRKCRPCSQKNRLCYFGHIQSPTPQSIINGSIPLGTCIACLASGGRDTCVAIAGGTGELGTSPLKWYGPIRASFMSDLLGCEDYAISLSTARATNGKTIKGQFHDAGLLMMQMVHNIRDATHRPHWQSYCTSLSLLGQRLAVSLDGPLRSGQWSDTDSGDVDHASITGTIISANDLIPILNLSDASIPLSSPTSSYPLHLILALALRAQPSSSAPSLPGCYIYPKPLSPRFRPEFAVSSHIGPSSALLAGIMMESSTVSPGFRYGAWVIDPISVGPEILTFGIPADFQAFQDPISLLDWGHLTGWSISHIPYQASESSAESDVASGPRATEFLRLLGASSYLAGLGSSRPAKDLSNATGAIIDRLATSVLSTPHAEIRIGHFTQYTLDRNLSKRTVQHIQTMTEEDLAKLVDTFTAEEGDKGDR